MSSWQRFQKVCSLFERSRFGALLTISAGREVVAVARLLEEGCFAVGPELADGGIGLDHRVPQLRLVVSDGDDRLVALVAGPLPERVVRPRTRPAGADEIGILRQVALGQIGGGGDRGEHAAAKHLCLVLQDQLLGPGDVGVGLGLVILDDQLHIRAGEVALGCVEIYVEAIDRVLADLGEETGHGHDHAER
jgi:hypothetical protein